MALAMCCTAMLMKPSATSSALRAGRCLRELVELRAHRFWLERLVGARARTPSGNSAAGSCRPSRCIGHGQRAAAPVARRAGIGARGLRADAKARAVEFAGSSRRPRPRCGCSSSARACARPPPASRTRARTRRRSARRRSTCRPCRSRSPCRSRRAAPSAPCRRCRPPGPDRIASLPWKACASVRPPDDCMKNSLTPGHLSRHLLDVAAQDRRQIGIHHRGVAAADELHHRADLVRRADLREAHLRAMRSAAQLVLRCSGSRA